MVAVLARRFRLNIAESSMLRLIFSFSSLDRSYVLQFFLPFDRIKLADSFKF